MLTDDPCPSASANSPRVPSDDAADDDACLEHKRKEIVPMKTRLILPALLAAGLISNLAAIPASATTSAWMLNGKTFKEDGITTTTVKTTASLDKVIVASSAGIFAECTGNPRYAEPILKEGDVSTAASIELTGCRITRPTTCQIPETLATVPLALEGTLDGALATKGIVHPATGTTFMTVKIEGGECAAPGNEPVKGDLEMLSPEGQDERTDQLEEAKQGATGLLRLGSESASVEGAALVLLANNQAWSFL